MTQEELSYKYIPKTAIYYFLNQEYRNETALTEILNSFECSKKKEKQFMAMISFLKHLKSNDFDQGVPKKLILNDEINISALNSLEKNNVLFSKRIKIERLENNDVELKKKKKLADFQLKALEKINQFYLEKDICLLHGVTGSGKTEVYVELIEEQLNKGKQVLFLLPEIALTTQLIQRLSAYFGDLIGIYHSKFNQNERVEIWNHVLNNHPTRFRIILGARSSIFLPFQNLGLIIFQTI